MTATPLTVALIGNPNSGKSTLFNALTGLHQTIGNWPGVTVEKKEGYFYYQDFRIHVVDLPGIYHLSSSTTHRALDEQITLKYFLSGQANVIVNVIDATNLERNLYLTTQLLELNIPLVLVLNRFDLVKKQKISMDLKALSSQLHCPIIPMVSSKKIGLEDLRTALIKAAQQTSLDYPVLPYPSSLQTPINQIASQLASEIPPSFVRFFALDVLEREDHLPFIPLSDLLHQSITKTLHQIKPSISEDVDILIADTRYSWIHQLVQKVVSYPQLRQFLWTEKIDQWILNRFLSLPILLAIIYVIFFCSIFIGGKIQNAFALYGRTLFVDRFYPLLISFAVPDYWAHLLVNGLGEGLSTLLTFIPVLTFMFFFLAWLELSGYMARAAFIMDRIMTFIGLPGKAFLPLLIGFGCNVPGILATRMLENERERILTILMNPFMSCGARLAIYGIFAAAFFPNSGHNIIFGLYLLGIIVAIATGFFLRKTIFQGPTSPLIMELPLYEWPSLQQLFFSTMQRLKGFVCKAGIVIIPVCLALSFINSIPVKIDSQQTDSILAISARQITPFFHPMGIESSNWPATVGLITGILSKETVIATLNTLYNIDTTEPFAMSPLAYQKNQSISTSYPQKNNTPFYGQLTHRFQDPMSALAYLIFILLYMPCVGSIATIAQELNKRWALFSMLWSTAIAYSIAVLFYQIVTFQQHPLSSTQWILGILCFFIGVFFSLRGMMNLLDNRKR